VFKNAKVFQLSAPFTLDPTQLHERLSEHRARPCGPQELMTLGWASPLGPGAEVLVHPANGCLLIAARRQERLLPASVVNEAVAERVAEIEQAEMRDVPRRERTRLREELMVQMLPQAFTRSRLVRAYIDPADRWVVVDAASDKVAEEVLSLLRRTLGSLPARPLRPGIPVADRLTAWVATGGAEAGFDIEDQCELRDPADSKAVVRCRGHDLTTPEIKTHLDAGKRVVALAVNYQDHLSLLLDEDLALKRLRFADELIEEAIDDDAEDETARLDAELTLLTGELRGLLSALVTTFQVPDQAGEPVIS
jgi:recombination associated protein RdgC